MQDVMANPNSDLDRYVDAKVSSGEFGSREEFFLETARVYRELEARHADLKSLIQERIDEAERCELDSLDIDAIKAELARELDTTGQSK
jgi:Arc/MetJ-type ribon-helix-helix transcriptional regulator